MDSPNAQLSEQLGDLLAKLGVGKPETLLCAILVEAEWAHEETQGFSKALPKADLRAEQQDLRRCLSEASNKLKRLSPDFDKLLDACPLEVAESLDAFLPHVEAAGAEVDEMPQMPKRQELERGVAVELAVRVLRILQEEGIPASATASVAYRTASPAIQVLRLIGDNVGPKLEAATWRRIVAEAKRRAPDLKVRRKAKRERN